MLGSSRHPHRGGHALDDRNPGTEQRYEKVTRILGLAVFAPLLMAFTLPVAVGIAERPDYGCSFHNRQVVAVEDGGPADRDGLRRGDLVQGVNGRFVAHTYEIYGALAGAERGTSTSFMIARDDELLVVRVLPGAPRQRDMIRGYTLWITGLAFLAIGWWVLYKRNDPVARGFFGLCFVFAFFLLGIPDHPDSGYMVVKEALRMLMQFLLPAFFLRFFLMFPGTDPATPASRRAASSRWLLLPGLVLFAITVAVWIWHPDSEGSNAEHQLEMVTMAYFLVYFVAGLFFFARRALRRDRPIQRTKMAVVLLGLVVGLVPFLGTMLLAQAVPDRAADPAQYLGLSLVLVPSSFALAIMRYGALDRAFVVRASLVYGTLTLLVLVGYMLAVVILGQVLSNVFGVSTYPVLLVVVAVTSLAILPLRGVVQEWVDNAFYPARRVHREKLTRLADELAEQVETDQVVRSLHAELGRLFRPRCLEILLSEGPDALLRAAPAPDTGCGPGGGAEELEPDGDLARLLLRRRRPLHTEEIEDMLLGAGADSASLSWLDRNEVQLVAPLVSGRRLVGLCAFGPKTGGALYSQEDLANLRGIALQAGSILESRRFYRDSLRRQRLETELEVARGIQSGLLPVEPLVTREFGIAGRNVACRGVGGDYYDYFLREDGQLAFAIADVAGKGIPAALLMTSLCTSFRREAESRLRPAEVATALNGALGARIAAGRFVCFFCAVWDPAGGLLRYCNAGMEPPILFRPGSTWLHRLRKGGPPVGAAPDHTYREGALTLEPGDRLFLHTDGLTDQRNEAGEFYDETRLLDSVAHNLDRSPMQLIDAVFAAVHQFGGAGESDDMTAILLEIKDLAKNDVDGPLLAQAGWDRVDDRGLPATKIRSSSP